MSNIFGDVTIGEKVFKPADRDTKTNAFFYENRSGGVPLGYQRLSLRTTANATVRRVKVNLTHPVIQAPAEAAADGFTPRARLSHSHSFSCETVCSNVGSEAERQSLINDAKALVEHVLLASLVVNQDVITG